MSAPKRAASGAVIKGENIYLVVIWADTNHNCGSAYVRSLDLVSHTDSTCPPELMALQTGPG